MAKKPVAPPKPVDPQYGQSWYGPGASVIPDAGTYLQQQAQAQNAWDRSVAQLKATRAQQQIRSGLGQDWSVDPRAQYGAYQSMLQQEGGNLDAQQMANQERGFFGPGLGNQGLSSINYANALEQLGFKNQMSDWESQYQQGMADAQRQKQADQLAAMQGAYSNAASSGDYPQGDPYPPAGNPAQTPAPVIQPQYGGSILYRNRTNPFVPRGTRGARTGSVSVIPRGYRAPVGRF